MTWRLIAIFFALLSLLRLVEESEDVAFDCHLLRHRHLFHQSFRLRVQRFVVSFHRTAIFKNRFRGHGSRCAAALRFLHGFTTKLGRSAMFAVIR